MRVAVLATAVLASLVATPSASAAPRTGPPEAPAGTLAASAVGAMHGGDQLAPNEYLESPDGNYALFVEPSGLLTLYGPTGAYWIRDDTENAVTVVMQGDGNLVAYDAGGTALWSSGTYAPGALLAMQDDGNLVIYRANGTAAWSSGSSGSYGLVPDRLLAGQRLLPGESLVSDNGTYELIMQEDGNMVVYRNGSPIWSSGTTSIFRGSDAVMQPDGNFVVYAQGRPNWHSRTSDRSGAHLIMQDDGNAVIYRPNGTAIWASMASRGELLHKTALKDGEHLSPGQSLVSPRGYYRLLVQPDGNLVVYGPTGTNWSSATGVPNSSLVLTATGNLVLAAGPTANANWNTGDVIRYPTAGHFEVDLQDDGNLVLYQDGSARWASLTPRNTPGRYPPLWPAPAGGWW
jgi:hypothetical protein